MMAALWQKKRIHCPKNYNVTNFLWIQITEQLSQTFAYIFVHENFVITIANVPSIHELCLQLTAFLLSFFHT